MTLLEDEEYSQPAACSVSHSRPHSKSISHASDASERALTLVRVDEFAHDYAWDAYWTAVQTRDRDRIRELQLPADAMALLTLKQSAIGPEHLMSAVQKLTRYNESAPERRQHRQLRRALRARGVHTRRRGPAVGETLHATRSRE